VIEGHLLEPAPHIGLDTIMPKTRKSLFNKLRQPAKSPASEPVVLTWIPGRCPSSSTVCPPPTHVDRGREVPDYREFPARHFQSG
jgi:hypothetical protein